MQNEQKNFKKIFITRRSDIFSNSLKMACTRNVNAKNLFKGSGRKICRILHCCLKFQRTSSPLKRRAEARNLINIPTEFEFSCHSYQHVAMKRIEFVACTWVFIMLQIRLVFASPIKRSNFCSLARPDCRNVNMQQPYRA